MDDFVILKVFGSSVAAETAKTLLDANGIETKISANDSIDVDVTHAPPASSGVKLLVLKKDFEKAQKLFS